jgi:hypothetical protein
MCNSITFASSMSRIVYFILFFTIILRVDLALAEEHNPSNHIFFHSEQQDSFNITILSESDPTTSEQENLDFKNTDIGQNDDLTSFEYFFIKRNSVSLFDVFKFNIIDIFLWQLKKPPIICCAF